MSSLVASTSWSMYILGSECRRRCRQGRHRHRRRCISLVRNVVDDVVKAGIDVAVPGYEPLLLGADAAAAGPVIGGRMEEISAESRELTLAPGGYVEQHLKDPAWWNDSAVPSAATHAVMGRMAQLSTRLVADAWYTAWNLSQHNASRADAASAGAQRAGAAADADDARWKAAVEKAAAFDRMEARAVAA